MKKSTFDEYHKFKSSLPLEFKQVMLLYCVSWRHVAAFTNMD